MRSSRKAILAASIGAVLVACGLEVTGIDPIPDRGPDSGADTSVSAHPDATLDAEVEIRDAGSDADADAPAPCDAGGGSCDYCDPALVLCIEFDGGIVDQSMYHRSIDVRGTPTFFTQNGHGAISLDGSVGLSVPGDSRLPSNEDVTIEIRARVRSAPPDGGRFGLVDRNNVSSMFYYWDGRLTCHGVAHQFDPAAVVGNMGEAACVATRDGKASLFVNGARAMEGDAAAPPGAHPGEPTMIGRDDLGGDASALSDMLQGDIEHVRIYHRARSAKEIARAAGLDAGP